MTLPRPVGEQRRVVSMTPSGHAVVLGTAGSGKTTMAVHRAAHLGDPRTGHAGPTLLLTYNRALLAYFDHLGAATLPNVTVCNYHRFARGYLNARGLMGTDEIVKSDQSRKGFIRMALDDVRRERGTAGVLGRDEEFFFSELRYMAQHGLLTRETYLASERIGRRQALDPAARPLVFDVQDRYVALRAARGFRYDWDDIAFYARCAFELDGPQRMYRHIVIDEGQDFSPEMIRSLALAMRADGSLTLFGDVAQQIYGRGISWRRAGLNVNAVWRFEHNYRNTPEVAALGLEIAAMPYFRDQPDMVAPRGFRASGPPPTLVRLSDIVAESSFVVQQARAASVTDSVGVLLTRHEDEPRFAAAFQGAQRLDRDLERWRGGPGISYGTVHSAKGFEFDTVILVGVTADRWPEPRAVAADGEEEATAVGGRLLYVGVTRARQNLIMTATGDLTRLLPGADGLWTTVTR
ncbi:3'-5' exonuclease [Conexibacter sp. CPCC 206217]|uniref:3'-5' exonuclease n=1 Tax=Conexibacter sp. CPCC 206217 TaxID=3064574 RepID=UPI002716A3D3|nr:3'-5' exonuclease [Conexibacter sp. CPCC 206217]MDO8211010.1 AAA family ATPase [Conexibacter sp. CPCC 206217]